MAMAFLVEKPYLVDSKEFKDGIACFHHIRNLRDEFRGVKAGGRIECRL